MSSIAIKNVRRARNIVALQRTARRDSAVRAELDPVIADLRADLDETMSKSQAAQVIGISVPTLDKWVDRRIVPVRKAPSGRPRIPRDTALDLAERIGDLRDRGQERNLIAGVVDMLNAETPRTSVSSKRSTVRASPLSLRATSFRPHRPSLSAQKTDRVRCGGQTSAA